MFKPFKRAYTRPNLSSKHECSQLAIHTFFLVVYFAVPFIVREERAPLNPKSVISVETILVVGVKAKGFELKQKMQNIYS